MKKIFKYLSIICAVLLLTIVSVKAVSADGSYQIIIDDGEDLLSDEEEALLREKMKELTDYGNVAFASASQYDDTASYAKSLYRSYFGQDSGLLFLIDMGERNIWIFSDGAIYRVINKAYANTITDNVYRYASRGDYYGCAYEVYDQAATLLKGGRIAQPMKYISNLFIALVIALLVSFIILLVQRHDGSFATKEVAASMTSAVGVYVLTKEMIKSRKHRHVESDGGGGSSGGGGGGGGGGSSGGGGGHSF